MVASSIASPFSFFTPSKPPAAAAGVPPFKFPPSQPSAAAPRASSSRRSPLVLSSESQLMSVVSPSLANANTIFFRSAYNVQVIVEDNEPEEKLLSRFRREVMRAGVIQECKRRRFFENKQNEKKRKSREAAKRNRRRRPQARSGPQDKQETLKNKDDEDNDNWDLPEGDFPY